jgi:hypothetical protein
MTTEEAVQELTNFILINHESGNKWYISLTNDVVETAKNLKFGIYQEAKSVFDAMANNPKRAFESVTEVDADYNPLWVSIWNTTLA